MRTAIRRFLPVWAIVLFLFSAGGRLSYGADYYCEVMTVKGSAFLVNDREKKPLKEGDLLKNGDRLEVAEASYVDLAYDRQWNNLTRIRENSQVTICSIYPTGLSMKEGDIFAKLHALPKNSTFEIETPTAVAAVRGSEYRTLFREGETSVFNFSESKVQVFALDTAGRMMEDKPAVLSFAEKTSVAEAGEPPKVPEKMTEAEVQEGRTMESGIKENVAKVEDEGRLGQIQNIAEVEKRYPVEMGERLREIAAERTVESAVADKDRERNPPSEVSGTARDAALKERMPAAAEAPPNLMRMLEKGELPGPAGNVVNNLIREGSVSRGPSADLSEKGSELGSGGVSGVGRQKDSCSGKDCPESGRVLKRI
jgi:hypothetical protein